MEKLDDSYKTNDNKANYHHQNLDHSGARNSREAQEKTNFRLDHFTDEEDDEDDEGTLNGEDEDVKKKIALCPACNLMAELSPEDEEEEPVFCNRCSKCLVAARSVASFKLYGTESQHSNFTCSQASIDSFSRPKMRSTRTYDVQPSSRENARGSWTQEFSTPMTERNQRLRYGSRVNKTESVPDWQTTKSDYRDSKQRSFASIVRKDEDFDAVSLDMKMSNRIASECSRRPIRCPRLDCAVNIAFSALTHHFLFDHPEVPILCVEPGMKSTLIFSFSTMACDSSRCLALLLVSDKLSGAAAKLFNGSQIHPKYRNRLPLAVLAAKSTEGEIYAGGEGYYEGSGIIVWLAGLDVGNSATGSLKCSIEAVDDIETEGFRSLMYTGPINSLRTAQCPREVLLNGDCILLNEGLIKHITSGSANLNVNVVVH